MIKKLLTQRIKGIFNSNVLKTIGTHDGAFHADEVLACTMLRKHTAEFLDAKIIRSRDLKLLSTADIVLDVGSEYNPATRRFDHHQREFAETFTPYHNIKLSSAGLIYKHYGREVVKSISERYIKEHKLDIKLDDERMLDLIYYKLYENFILCMDAIDNGVSQFPADVKPRYTDPTGIGSRIGRLNPVWHEEVDAEEHLKRFEQAIEVMDAELKAQLKEVVVSWIPSKQEVQKAFDRRFETHKSGSIIHLDRACAWKSHLVDIEVEAKKNKIIKFVLYPDKSSNTWRVQAVPAESGSFLSRAPLKEDWRGLRDEELAEKSGIPDARFVHSSGFIGGAKSLKSALKLAELSLV